MGGQTVGLLHPGEMGVSIGAAAKTGGHEVLWVSRERGPATRDRALRAAFTQRDDLSEVLEAAEVVIGVCPPHAAKHLAATRDFSGTAVLIGVMPIGTNVELPVWDVVLREKSILGSMMGSNRFRVDMPRYVDLYLRGELMLDEMISARLPLDQINDGFEAMRKGTAARSVVVFE